ncbi:hypothetical protein BH11BAC2_BH11BAC2_12370 [soil metagenome]
MTFGRMTLVIGAGASKALHREFGLGIDLVNDIISRLEDKLLCNILYRKYGKTLPIAKFVEALSEYKENAIYPSIDQFISEVNEYPEFEKFKIDFNNIALDSICYHILGYEGRLTDDDYFSNKLFEKTWLYQLILWMKETDFFSSPVKSTCLKIITFNYDRTIEFFLLNYFPEYDNQVKIFIKESIIHIYGHVGHLVKLEENTNIIHFAAKNDDTINWNSDNMKLQYDQRNENTLSTFKSQRYIATLIQDTKEKSEIFGYSDNSDLQVCFFGFAFDNLNCQRLNLTFNHNNLPKYFANIHPQKYDYGFKIRRANSNKLRMLRTDFNFSYLEAVDFLQSRLLEFKITY